jgi:hypothetical protein
VLPVIVNRETKWSEDGVDTLNLTTLSVGTNTLNPNVLYSNGGFRSVYYFSKIPTEQITLFGFSMLDGSVPLTGKLPISERELIDVTYTSQYPVLFMNVTDWTYNMIGLTSRNSTTETYNSQYALSTDSDSSILTFDDSSLYDCITSAALPATSCNVIDSIGFTIVQKLPSFGGTYDSSWKTNVFYLPGGVPMTGIAISIVNSIDPTKPAYVFKGILKFQRTNIYISRLNRGSTVTLEQDVVSNYTNATYESLYKNIKIGSIIQLYKQFNSGNTSDAYKWTQQREFVIRSLGVDDLLPEYKDYRTDQFVSEFLLRITKVLSYLFRWCSSGQLLQAQMTLV